VQVIINIPPTIDAFSFNLNESLYAHHNWNITAKYEIDQERQALLVHRDEFNCERAVSGIQGPPTACDSSDPDLPYPQSSGQAGVHHPIIRMCIWDIYNELTPNSYFLYIYIKSNYPPYMKVGTIDLDIGTIQVPFKFTNTFKYSDFLDDENIEILINCTKHLHISSITPNWTLVENNKKDF
jgi:hypothetical protein